VKSFEYAAPKTLKEATALLSDSWGKSEVLAGGTDLVTCLKQGLVAPDRVVSLKNIAELKGIKADAKVVRIGAMTTLRELAEDKTIQQHFPALVTAAKGIGSAQMLSTGTVGGDLCQRPRCWYFRNGFGLLASNREMSVQDVSGKQVGAEVKATGYIDAAKSLVRDGDNRYHAIFGNDGNALFVSPSSLGPALIALGATVMAAGPTGTTREIPAADFFKTPKSENERETALKPNEVLTEISVPISGLKNATYEVRHRQGLDWPYVTAAVAFKLSNGSASDARVVLGHVAPVPWTAKDAAAALNNVAISDEVAAKTGEAAAKGAKPLSKNGYKVQLVRTAVKRAVLAAKA
jgi:xanthine dehydrogenase YagS FAD-binding subunit